MVGLLVGFGWSRLIDKRRDLGHRDGKTIDDERHVIDENTVITRIGLIENFANDIFENLEAAMKETSALLMR